MCKLLKLSQIHMENGQRKVCLHSVACPEVNKMQNVIATKLNSVVLFQHYLLDHFICQVYWHAKTTTTCIRTSIYKRVM